MKKLLFFVLAISIHFTVNAADGFSTLEERMSGKEFKETGLGKLTDLELTALNDWLRSHSVATLENAAARSTTNTANASTHTSTSDSEDMRGFENRPKEEEPGAAEIHGTIAGTFNGWRGKGSLFKLTNGMTWKQVQDDTFAVRSTENAEVIIRKGLMGDWRLSMVGYDSSVRVERIK